MSMKMYRGRRGAVLLELTCDNDHGLLDKPEQTFTDKPNVFLIDQPFKFGWGNTFRNGEASLALSDMRWEAQLKARTRYTFHVPAVRVIQHLVTVKTDKDDNGRITEEKAPSGWKVAIPGGSAFTFIGEENAPDIEQNEILEITLMGTGKHAE